MIHNNTPSVLFVIVKYDLNITFKMKNIFFSLIILSGLLFTACEEEGNALIDFSLRASNVEDQRFRFDSAYINPVKIALKGNKKNESKLFSAEGVKKINLFSQSVFGSAAVIEGDYTEVKAIISIDKSIQDVTFFIHGNYTNSLGESKAVEVYLDETIDIITAHKEFSIDRNQHRIAKISIDLSKLFSEISNADMDNAVVSGNKIYIARDPNEHLYLKLLNKLNEASLLEFQ